MKRAQPERQLHQAVAQYLARALPANCFATTIGHGGGGKVRGAILKSMGVVAGVPDILILWRGRALFIELKSPKGRVSPDQAAAHLAIFRALGAIAICRSLEEVERALANWGVPLRAKIAA